MNVIERDLLDLWAMTDALRSGTDAMRRAGVKYLPMTRHEWGDRALYNARLNACALHPAYRTAIEHVVGKVFQRPVQVTGLDNKDARFWWLPRIVADADRAGTSLTTWSADLFDAALHRGLSLVLVGMPRTIVDDANGVAQRPMSLGEERQADLRPFFSLIRADDIDGCRFGATSTGRMELLELRVRSFQQEAAEGLDPPQTIEVLSVWRPGTVQRWRRPVTNNGVAHDFIESPAIEHGYPGIPVATLYTNRTGPMQALPPFADLAHMNVEHWRSRSHQAVALDYVRNPILLLAGMSGQDVREGVAVGPGSTVTTMSSDADVRYAEISGASLQAGERDIEQIERKMVAMGMAPFAESRAGDTATGRTIDESRTQTRAQGWAEALEQTLYDALTVAARWLQQELPEDVDVSVFRDFALFERGGQDLQYLQSDAAAGRITTETYLREAKKRGLYGDAMDPALEAEEAAQNPPLGTIGGGL